MKLVKLISFFCLLFFPIIFIVMTSIEWLSRSIGVFCLLIIIGLLLVYFALKMIKSQTLKEPMKWSKTDLLDYLFALIASVMTYLFAMLNFVSPVLASASIGLLGSLLLKKHDKAIFAGSFLGMAEAAVFGVGGFLVAALIMSLVFVLTKTLFQGVGGKLGTVAFSGAVLAYFIFDLTPLSSINLSIKDSVFIIIAAIAGAVLTRVLSEYKEIGVVKTSSIIGLIFVIIFDYQNFSISPYIAIVGFGGSFVGMSDKVRMKNRFVVGFGGLIFGVIYYLSLSRFVGFGGKLGTIAFVSSIITIGLFSLLEKRKTITLGG